MSAFINRPQTYKDTMEIIDHTKNTEKNSVLTVLLVDKSGSMSPYIDGTVSGINEVLENKDVDSSDRVSLYTFSDRFEILMRTKKATKAKPVTREDVKAMGLTALYDAMGITIREIEEYQRENPNTKVLLYIITDGLDNKSKEWNAASIKARLADKDWEVIYLGAGQDAVTNGANIGASKAFNYSNDKLEQTYQYMNATRSAYKVSGTTDTTDTLAQNIV